jgi:hypothetical protein
VRKYRFEESTATKDYMIKVLYVWLQSQVLQVDSLAKGGHVHESQHKLCFGLLFSGLWLALGGFFGGWKHGN